ncbi:cryptochrome/photolyase family protein [Acidipila sp. EB88]|uniref:cryptochrome/photolyase family protein n=1 Tax=Acidipila sp. EB88 TaxID=2305226 RepID=UPI001F1A6ED2|nr:cryptochrome/photolyase family protein [Acidipila sp. EB88]
MPEFQELIRDAAPGAGDVRHRRWIYVPYDRLCDGTGPLAETTPGDAGIVMMEALAKAHRRPYHKRKLVLILASQRQFALEQAARGVKVAYLFTPGIFADGLQQAQQQYGFERLEMMEPAEREMRADVAEAAQRGIRINQVPDTTWLSTAADFERVYGKPAPGPVSRHYVMDRFYRFMREKTNTLMRGGQPLGGQFSFDTENRKSYRGTPRVPIRPTYAPDDITLEAIEQVERAFPDHFGNVGNWQLPMRKPDIDAAWAWTVEHLLPVFGPFEDAMYTPEPDMFHSRMSAFLNISRLLPAGVVGDVLDAAAKGLIPLASAEGFVRQILGWREFMRHIHRVTDGYRNIDVEQEPPRTAVSGEAATVLVQGITQHAEAPPRGATAASLAPQDDTGARPSALGAALPLPAAYWGVPSGLNCLDTVVRQVIDEGWSHHITRLMVLSNFATLCGYSPRELCDWFWIGYVDAYDWVVEPNVLGMSTFGDGGITATKPYVSGAAYINRMSDYCGRCQYNPKIALGRTPVPILRCTGAFLRSMKPC